MNYYTIISFILLCLIIYCIFNSKFIKKKIFELIKKINVERFITTKKNIESFEENIPFVTKIANIVEGVVPPGESNNPDEVLEGEGTNISNEKKNVYFDIGIDGNNYDKRIEIQLFDNIVPKTCKNFRELCLTKKFKNSFFHRVIKDFMLQGGDFTNHDGTGGYSIYGDKFEDENFSIKHTEAGLLSMANAGPNTNGSQFFIITVPTPHLDNKHVVFGKVVKNLDYIHTIENLEVNENDKPIKNCIILDSGVID